MTGKTPLVLIGFMGLVSLPAVLAGVSIGLGLDVPYTLKLDLWTVPWIYVGWLVLLAFLIDVRRHNQPWQALPPVVWAAMLVLLGVSLAHRQLSVANVELSDMQLFRTLLAVGVGVAAYYGMGRYQERFAKPVYVVLFLSTLLLVPAVLVFIYLQAPANAPAALFSWHLPGFGAVRLFGMALEVGIVVAVGLLIDQQARGFTLVLWMGIIALWAVVFWTGGRGAVISMLGAAMVVSVARPDLAKAVWKVLLISAVFGAVLSLWIRVPEGSNLGLINMFFRSTQAGVDAVSSGRIDRWVDVMAMIGDRPWLGHGLGQFSNLWPNYMALDLSNGVELPLPAYFLAYRTVHNMVLEILLAWGLIGGALCLWLLAMGWGKSFSRVRSRASSLRVPAFLGLNVLLVHSLLAGVYAVPYGLFYMALFFGICLAPKSAQTADTNG